MAKYASVAILAGISSSVAVFSAAIVFEALVNHGYVVRPHVSYGQAFALFGWPLSTCIGSFVGCAIFRFWTRANKALEWSWFIAFSCLAIYASMLWRNDIERYGHDTSQFIVHGPATLISMLGIVVSLSRRGSRGGDGR